MEAFSLGVRKRRGGVHKTGVGGCIHRMIRANRLKVARVSNDLRDFRQFFQLVGHETVGESDSVDLWKRGDSNRWAVGWCFRRGRMGLQEQGVILPSLLCMMDGLLSVMGMMLSFCMNMKSMGGKQNDRICWKQKERR